MKVSQAILCTVESIMFMEGGGRGSIFADFMGTPYPQINIPTELALIP